MKRLAVALPALFLVSYVLPLGVPPLTMRDECRYAEIPREMRASGDWIVPHLNGLRYFEKPPVGYWLTALSISALGESNFAVRFAAVLSAGATVLILFLLVRRFGGGAIPAAAAAAVLLTSGMFDLFGGYNVLDLPVTLFLTAGLALFFCAYQEATARKRALYLAGFGACCGAAFLTKGFIALAVPCVAIVPFLAWERQLRRIFRLAWLPLVLACLVAAPWAILVHLREPDFWRYFFWVEHVQRFTAHKAQHAQPFWYFVPVLLGGAFPWTLLAPAAAAGLGRQANRDALTRFALCWLVFPFLFFSASRGKLETYILPCFPALAILIALGLLRYFAGAGRRLFLWGAGALAALLALAALVLAVFEIGGLRYAPYGPGENWKWALTTAALLAFAALTALALTRREPHTRLGLIVAGAALFFAAEDFHSANVFEETYAPARFLLRNASHVQPSGPLCACNTTVNAACWYYQRADAYLVGDFGELQYGLGFNDAKHRGMHNADLREFIASFPSDVLVTVVMDHKSFRLVRDSLPPPEFEDTSPLLVFAQYRGGSPTSSRPAREP
jgi:4-amino-4-deoxy-L-arabinose transferase